MTKLLTAKRIAATAALTLTSTTLAVTAAAFAHPASATSGAFGPAASRLRTMVLRSDELAGFAAVNCPAVQDEPADWASTRSAEIPALRAEGFELGISELLYSATLHASGTSIAVRFGTATGARKDVERQIESMRRNGNAATFVVKGIPGAHGAAFSAANASGYQIAFTVGTYEYIVSIAFPSNQLESHPGPAETQVFTAARLVYRAAKNHK